MDRTLQDVSCVPKHWALPQGMLAAICPGPYTAWHRQGRTTRHLLHPDPVSAFSLQHIVHHNQVFTGYLPLLAGEVDHSEEPPVLPCGDHLVDLLYHLCGQRAGRNQCGAHGKA